MMQVTLYTKPNCHLCNQLRLDLAWIQRELDFSVVERNIEADPADAERFRYLIPVLQVGETFFYPPHDLMTLHSTLRAAADQSAVH